MTREEFAQNRAEAMRAEDNVVQSLSIEFQHVGPGEATLAMSVASYMLNGLGIGHGGYIFILADTALGFASNTRDQHVVAQHCSITYVAPVQEGDRLTAEAREISRTGRSGIFDVRVLNQLGETVAEFRGHTRTVAGKPRIENPR